MKLKKLCQAKADLILVIFLFQNQCYVLQVFVVNKMFNNVNKMFNDPNQERLAIITRQLESTYQDILII